jgi:hypothetical protein
MLATTDNVGLRGEVLLKGVDSIASVRLLDEAASERKGGSEENERK